MSDVAETSAPRLEDGDWDICVFFTDLPSRAEHNPVRTEADPEHRVADQQADVFGSAERWPRASFGGRKPRVTAASEALDLYVVTGRSVHLVPVRGYRCEAKAAYTFCQASAPAFES